MNLSLSLSAPECPHCDHPLLHPQQTHEPHRLYQCDHCAKWFTISLRCTAFVTLEHDPPELQR